MKGETKHYLEIIVASMISGLSGAVFGWLLTKGAILWAILIIATVAGLLALAFIVVRKIQQMEQRLDLHMQMMQTQQQQIQQTYEATDEGRIARNINQLWPNQ